MTRPVVIDMTPFDPSRVLLIRLAREKNLVEGLEKYITKKAKKSKSPRKKKEIKLDAKASAALATLDPAMQAMLQKAMKGK